MKQNPIDNIAKRYYQRGVWLMAAITLVALAVMNVLMDTSLVNALVVSVLFNLVSTIAYSVSWKAVAKSSPDNLAKFYLAATVIRMLIALAVATVVIVLTEDKQEATRFAVVFVIFYLAMLTYDTIYFSRVEKNNKTN